MGIPVTRVGGMMGVGDGKGVGSEVGKQLTATKGAAEDTTAVG